MTFLWELTTQALQPMQSWDRGGIGIDVEKTKANPDRDPETIHERADLDGIAAFGLESGHSFFYNDPQRWEIV